MTKKTTPRNDQNPSRDIVYRYWLRLTSDLATIPLSIHNLLNLGVNHFSMDVVKATSGRRCLVSNHRLSNSRWFNHAAAVPGVVRNGYCAPRER